MIRSVGERSKAVWIEATTQSRWASVSSVTSSVPSALMFTSTPLSSFSGATFPASLSISLACCSIRPSRR